MKLKDLITVIPADTGITIRVDNQNIRFHKHDIGPDLLSCYVIELDALDDVELFVHVVDPVDSPFLPSEVYHD